MKRLVKGPEPAELTAWKSSANDDWKPTYTSLQNPEKAATHQALVREQGYVCCYCGREIEPATSHIEHFRPQEQRPDLALDFGNLHASCIRETKPGLPLHCGHLKDSWFDEDAHVSPLDPNCEDRFVFTLDGQVQPKDQGAANMVRHLGLDIDFLLTRRREALAGVFDPDFIATATPEELDLIKAQFVTPKDGKLASFGHVIAQYATRLRG